jgi:sulfate permease, SulP family
MKVGEMRRFHQLAPREFWLGIATLLGVIVLDVLPALIIGVVLALMVLIYRASRPLISILGADPHTPGAFEDIKRHPDATPVPGALIARPDATLFYANAELVRDAIEQAVTSSSGPVHAVVLVLDANDDLDITSTEQLEKLTDTLHGKNVALGLAHVHGPALQMAQRSGLLAKIGPDHIFETTVGRRLRAIPELKPGFPIWVLWPLPWPTMPRQWVPAPSSGLGAAIYVPAPRAR